MPIGSHDITQKEPVHFRIRNLGPSLLTQLANGQNVRPLDRLTIEVEYVNKPGGIHFGVSNERVAPYLEAILDAQRSQAVYWVNWNNADTPTFPSRMNDSTVDRLLKALMDHQLVPADEGTDEPNDSNGSYSL